MFGHEFESRHLHYLYKTLFFMRKIIITESQLKEIVKGMFKVYMMVGIPGSGKSTWCKQNHPDLPVVSRDIIRAELGFTKNADEKVVLTREQEDLVTQHEYAKMKEYCNKKQSFIVDDTNTGYFRAKLIEFLHSNGAYVIGVNINTPLDVCIRRREGQIPAEAMQRIFSRKVDLKPEEVDDIINVS